MTRRSRPVKPTPAEKRIIDARLKKMYPQMYAVKLTKAEKNAIAHLSPDDRKAILRQIGLKLKDVYK